jgi:cytochrome b involved in lipid metabolism
LGAVAGHLQPIETKVTVDPQGERVNIEFSWKGHNAASTSTASPAPATPAAGGGAAAPKKEDSKSAASDITTTPPAKGKAEEKAETKAGGGAGEYTAEEVAKHNTANDCWVIVDGKVLDVTKVRFDSYPHAISFLTYSPTPQFLPDHPGGEKAILLYAGRDATEEFNMLHDPKVIPRYAPDATIGVLKK